ncbi:metallophosphoesterase [Clostridium tyrobutyricum]|uniref:metallophosphoesterase n=1 Tax=Clostridium tyrobutyricum TaxID=1519 RepID=UPI00057DBB28|nr:metallophosphoesterase [Clostridium tyrobutyricum]
MLNRNVFFAVYTIVNLYLGFRILNIVKYFMPNINLYLYWFIFIVVAFSFVVERYKPNIPFKRINKTIYFIGSYWMAILLYAVMASIIIGILRILILINIIKYYDCIIISDLIAVGVISFILILGTFNARRIKVTKYNINLNKSIKEFDKLNIVMVSDIHLGRLMGKNRLKAMVDRINSMNSDVLVLAGDIIDDDMNMDDCYDILRYFKNIKSRYGIYAVYGNHEYIGSNTYDIKPIYKKLKINLLEDTAKNIDDKFYIVGRNDKYSEICKQTSRKTVEELLETLDLKKPVVLVDHQPLDLENCKKYGVDIQLSGHTHKGQMYPNNLITKKVFKIDYGHLKDGSFNCIVSCDFGTWGPPIRLGSKSEIVQILVKFL